jgi:pimeloyl-ACP methyl ester carboxylesterase
MKGGSMRIPGIAEKMAQAIPNCTLIEIPEASHDLPNENPTHFIRALRAFLIEPSTQTGP